MSERGELERDIAEEDELRRLFRTGDSGLVAPPMAAVERRVARPRSSGIYAAVALAVLLVVIAAGIGLGRRPVTSPSSSALPTITSVPASAVPSLGTGTSYTGLCPEPPKPGYLPWPTHRSEVDTSSTGTTSTWLAGDYPATEPAFRLGVVPYGDLQPTTDLETAGSRHVYVYFTSSSPVEARAWWRDASGVCPVVTAALVWSAEDRASLRSELLRIVASIPPVATPIATARPAADYGFLTRLSSTRLQVTAEDGSVIGTIDDVAGVPAVSRDGRQIAYWSGTDASELWIAPIRDVQQRQKLATLSNERGTGVVWSPTGKTLMFTAASLTTTGGPGASATSTAIRVVGVDGAAPAELARLSTGRDVRPLAWDETIAIGAAEEDFGQKGPGRYVVVSTHSVVEGNGTSANYRFIDLPDAQVPNVTISSLEASGDARFVMASWAYPDRNVVRFWPIYGLDFGQMRELSPQRADDVLRGPAWRPDSLEIGVAVAGHLELWALDGERQSVPLNAGVLGFWFRYDGTGVYTSRVGSGVLGITDLADPSPMLSLSPPAGSMLASVDPR